MTSFFLASIVVLTNCHGRAAIETRGANILSYVPHGEREVLFKCAKDYAPPRWFHGGIPICWPWFGRNGDPGTPLHGFAWARDWKVESLENGESTSRIRMLLEEAGKWRLEYDVCLDESLSVLLTMRNLGDERFVVTTGFHPYFSVSNPGNVSVLTPSKEILCQPGMDGGRPFGEGTYRIVDRESGRTIELRTSGNSKLVIWSVGPDGDTLSGLAPDDWRKYICVEPAVMPRCDGYYLNPGEVRTIGMSMSVCRQER